MFTHLGQYIKKIVAVTLALLLISHAFSVSVHSAAPVEIPGKTFTGTNKASSILANIDYTDVRNSKIFAKEAIWETGALELMKGYGAKRFAPYETLSIEQALSIAYIAAGREAEAQLAAETLDKARAADAKLYPTPKMWSDGYIQLAFNDGLITAAEYADALQTDQLALTGTNFLRKSSVTREDMAYYLAGILKLQPLYPQTKLFNSFSDWQTASPYRVPPIEAILQNDIMHGDNTGRFRPKGFLSRAEAAQMLQNAEPVIFPILGLTKWKGTVEGVELSEDWTSGVQVTERTVHIRNTDGTLHDLILREPKTRVSIVKNELTGSAVNSSIDTVVANDIPYAGKTLIAGDQIVYVSTGANEVPYVQVQKPTSKKVYLGRIETVDLVTGKILFTPYIELPSADNRLINADIVKNLRPAETTSQYIVSKNAKIFDGQVQQTIESIEPETYAMITVENGMVTSLDLVKLDLLQKEGTVSGIVADNNASLGYITLYSTDASGVSSGLDNGFADLRNYSYKNPVLAIRDNIEVNPDAIIPGDSVFLQVEPDARVSEIRAVSDYSPVYGTVLKGGLTSIQIRTKNGSAMLYPISSDTSIIKDGKLALMKNVVVGDEVRLLVQSIGNSLNVAEVRLERQTNPVAGIYRGKYVWYDDLMQEVVVNHLQRFSGGVWEWTDDIGSKTIELDDNYKPDLSDTSTGELFFAVKKGTGGEDRMIIAALKPSDRYEHIYDDIVVSSSIDGAKLGLETSAALFQCNDSTIAVKDGRLVAPSAIEVSDSANLSAGRDATTGTMIADVIVSETPKDDNGLTVFRGRVKSVTTGAAFTMESFARLDGVNWNFFNTPKTLPLNLGTTRLLTEGGVSSLRDFTSESFVGKSIYVLTDGTTAYSISDAPYGETLLQGRVTAVTGEVRDSFGSIITEAGEIELTNARRYNPLLYSWTAETAEPVTVPAEAIVIRKGLPAAISDIRSGDQVTILQSAPGGSGWIVRAE